MGSPIFAGCISQINIITITSQIEMSLIIDRTECAQNVIGITFPSNISFKKRIK